MEDSMTNLNNPRKTITFIAVQLLAGLTLPTLVFSATFPFDQHGEQNIDTHQVGYSDVTITGSGSVTITTKFSNGKKISGNNFYAVTNFLDTKGNIVAAFVQWKGLDGSEGGRAREGVVNDTFIFPPYKLAIFDHVSFRFGTKNCGFGMVGLHLKDGDKDNGATFSTIECGDVPK
jgi:hypothetical protein